MSKRLIPSVVCVLILALSGGAARAAYLAAYWDADYGTVWSDWTTTAEIRDYFEAAGYEILTADELKAWMDDRIADRAPSVVVFCSDLAPQTVVETNTAGCTLRQYLNAGGKIVFYGDIPFYNQGNPGRGRTLWAMEGAYGILGFDAASREPGTWDSGNMVQITPEGQAWGLTEPWQSYRPTSPYAWFHFTVLATDNAGNAAGWVAHYVTGDTTRGFVRLFDRSTSPTRRPNLEDMQRVAQYGLGPDPADGATHRETWAHLSWMPGPPGVSYNVYFGDAFEEVDEGSGDAFQGSQTGAAFVVGMAGSPYPNGLVPGTTYYWRIEEVPVNVGRLRPIRQGEVWSFTASPGSLVEDFESGDFRTFLWEHQGNSSWRTTIYESHSGIYSAQAGTIYDDETSTLRLRLRCASGEITFYHKVSSELGYDFLEFHIDHERQGKWSGISDWEQASFAVTKGIRTFDWTYSKDGSASDGEDTAWIDDIEFPVNPATLTSGPIRLTDATFDEVVRGSSVPVLVLFLASECEPCTIMEEVVHEIAAEYSSRARICTLDVDNTSNITDEFAIDEVPTLILFTHGQMHRRWGDVTSKNELTAALDDLLLP